MPHYFINVCRCCLKENPPLSQYLYQKDSSIGLTDYNKQLEEIYPDFQFDRKLPFQLCYDCQHLFHEAQNVKQFLVYQEDNEQCQKLLLKDDICASCLESTAQLFEKVSELAVSSEDGSKTFVDLLKTLFPKHQFDTNIPYKYCEECSYCIKSALHLKELLIANNPLYEQYCCALSGTTITFSHLSIKIYSEEKSRQTRTRFEEVLLGDNSIHCGYPIDLKSEIDDESFTDVNDEGYRCKFCQELFNEESVLRKHETIHTNVEKPFKCRFCEKAFRNTYHLRCHEKAHWNDKPYECNICQKIYTDKRSFVIHKRIHTGEKPYHCDECQKSFISKHHLVKHNKLHSGEYPHKCKICLKTFFNKSALTVHERVHNGNRIYKCNRCDLSFTQKGNLNRHLQSTVHSKEKRYKCQFCELAVTQKSSLIEHERIHTGEKPFKCSFCETTFGYKSVLKLHERTHTGEKPYKCTYCPKAFIASGQRTAHERKFHPSEKPYKCDLCPLSFNRSNSLTTHKRFHTGEKLMNSRRLKSLLKKNGPTRTEG